jgi:hypothetical protein
VKTPKLSSKKNSHYSRRIMRAKMSNREKEENTTLRKATAKE